MSTVKPPNLFQNLSEYDTSEKMSFLAASQSALETRDWLSSIFGALAGAASPSLEQIREARSFYFCWMVPLGKKK